MTNDNSPLVSGDSSLANRILSLFGEIQEDVIDLHTFMEMTGGNVPSHREAVLDTLTLLAERGLLRERGGDFYSLTEAGRLALAGPRDLTLLSRADCHLCEEAKTIIAPVAVEFRLSLREVDIEQEAALRQLYTNDVPVLFLGPEEIARHAMDAGFLRNRLTARFDRDAR